MKQQFDTLLNLKIYGLCGLCYPVFAVAFALPSSTRAASSKWRILWNQSSATANLGHRSSGGLQNFLHIRLQ